MIFQVRVVLNQSRWTPKCVSCDLLAIRLASFNQILDPWVYILLRRENIICFVKRTRRIKLTLFRSLSRIHSYGSERIAVLRQSLRHRRTSQKDDEESVAEVNDNIKLSENDAHLREFKSVWLINILRLKIKNLKWSAFTVLFFLKIVHLAHGNSKPAIHSKDTLIWRLRSLKLQRVHNQISMTYEGFSF